jgi:hypothetical protein
MDLLRMNRWAFVILEFCFSLNEELAVAPIHMSRFVDVLAMDSQKHCT